MSPCGSAGHSLACGLRVSLSVAFVGACTFYSPFRSRRHLPSCFSGRRCRCAREAGPQKCRRSFGPDRPFAGCSEHFVEAVPARGREPKQGTNPARVRGGKVSRATRRYLEQDFLLVDQLHPRPGTCWYLGRKQPAIARPQPWVTEASAAGLESLGSKTYVADRCIPRRRYFLRYSNCHTAKPETKLTLPRVLVVTLLSPFLAPIIPRLCLIVFRYAQPVLVSRAVRYLSTNVDGNSPDAGRSLIITAVVVYVGLAVGSRLNTFTSF